MPRTCRACSSPEREAIDKALVAGEPLRNIAKRVSISPASLFRHKSHLAGDGGDLSTQMREVTGFSALPPRKQKYIEGRIEGKTKVQAALDAGYSKAMANSAAHSIETKEVRAVFAELVRKKIPPEKIVQRIDEGMDAIETKFFQKDGVVTDSRDVIAWSERRQYASLAAEFGGYVDPAESNAGPANINIEIAMVGGDGAEAEPADKAAAVPVVRIANEERKRADDGDDSKRIASTVDYKDQPQQHENTCAVGTDSVGPAALPQEPQASTGFAILPPAQQPRRFLTRTGASMAFLRGGGSR